MRQLLQENNLGRDTSRKFFNWMKKAFRSGVETRTSGLNYPRSIIWATSTSLTETIQVRILSSTFIFFIFLHNFYSIISKIKLKKSIKCQKFIIYFSRAKKHKQRRISYKRLYNYESNRNPYKNIIQNFKYMQ